MQMFDPNRRNRNIGTAKQGRGSKNRMSIPEPEHGAHEPWERIGDAREEERAVGNRLLRFFFQPLRSDCVYACTVNDIVRVLEHVPGDDWSGIGAFLFRQPSRKEQLLKPVWGRLAYAADLVRSDKRVVYSGPVIVLEAINPPVPIKFGKRLSLRDMEELDRLRRDGHLIKSDRQHTVESSLESCRTTQLYRTLLHELGHWVDFLQRVEKFECGSDSYKKLVERFHSRPYAEKEQFAHSYAERIRTQLTSSGTIPFDRQNGSNDWEPSESPLTL